MRFTLLDSASATIAPPSKTTVWIVSVQITASMPPSVLTAASVPVRRPESSGSVVAIRTASGKSIPLIAAAGASLE